MKKGLATLGASIAIGLAGCDNPPDSTSVMQKSSIVSNISGGVQDSINSKLQDISIPNAESLSVLLLRGIKKEMFAVFQKKEPIKAEITILPKIRTAISLTETQRAQLLQELRSYTKQGFRLKIVEMKEKTFFKENLYKLLAPEIQSSASLNEDDKKELLGLLI